MFIFEKLSREMSLRHFLKNGIAQAMICILNYCYYNSISFYCCDGKDKTIEAACMISHHASS